jgi:hypothetical protein
MNRTRIPTALRAPEPWAISLVQDRRRTATFEVTSGGGEATRLVVERCVAGRLRLSYPVGGHDLEIRVEGNPRADVIRALATALLDADPVCRRIVLAYAPQDSVAIDEASEAGFRAVVEVDLDSETLQLLVLEPDWVRGVDLELDRVPT